MTGFEWLTDSIPAGRNDAISNKHLARILNRTEREIRKEIENARRAGILVCSCERGYFMPETLEELKEHAHRAEERVKTGRACLAPFIRTIRRSEKKCST